MTDENKLYSADTLVISDIHLGSEVARPKAVKELLQKYDFKRLILLGDIFDDLNHDEGLSEIMSHLIGIKVYKEYFWISNGKKYIAIHGHQFDRFLNENIIISNVSSFIYNKIQKYDKESQRVSRFIKRRSKGWLRLSNKVADSALDYARFKEADIIFCGHTHQTLYKKSIGIEYYNSGCWTDVPSSYVVIDNEGIPKILYYENP